MSVREQLGGNLTAHIEGLSDDAKKENRRYWKSRVEYGQRWIVEIIISGNRLSRMKEFVKNGSSYLTYGIFFNNLINLA